MKFITFLLSIIMIISVVLAAKPSKGKGKGKKHAHKKHAHKKHAHKKHAHKKGKKSSEEEESEEESFKMCFMYNAKSCARNGCKWLNNKCIN
jgi:hypothetical protein